MGFKKRNKDEIERDRARVSELMMMGYTHQEIATVLGRETGLELTRRQVTFDVAVIRDRWRQSQLANYTEVVSEELVRIDVLEKELWRTLRAGMSSGKRFALEEMRKIIATLSDSEEQLDEVMVRIRPFLEVYAVNPIYFSQILEAQKERRRILGVYAPTKVSGGLQVNTSVTVKGYSTVSPDDWPDTVEGEYRELAALGPGEKNGK